MRLDADLCLPSTGCDSMWQPQFYARARVCLNVANFRALALALSSPSVMCRSLAPPAPAHSFAAPALLRSPPGVASPSSAPAE